jgi:nitrite reductase (NADH) large subunit
MRRKELAIVGNGMAVDRLLDELRARGGLERYCVSVFSEEGDASYNRILLSRVLSGEAPDAIVTKPRAWYEEAGVRLFGGTSVSRLDTATRRLHTADGGEFAYDLAVLATGSRPLVPPIQGISDGDGDLKHGAFVYRTLDDALRIRASARPGDNAVVLGGGLLGLEAAKVLCDYGLHVTVVHLAASLMDAQIDSMGGEMLGQHVQRFGIFVRTGQTLEGIVGEKEVEGVVLSDGRMLPADVVVLACGVRPRVDVAKVSGIPINKGILVNDTLATEIPGVYALGECVEHRGRTYGLVAPAWEQACVLADVLTGANPQARYRGS